MGDELETDSKYRSYTTQVEKVLKQFESPREWADLCAYLTKLKKILQSNSKYPLIPKKLLVAKRLAQCLHHALPSGVHLKTLEVYALIFKRIGTDRLARDLAIYSMGLFPLMGHCAMNVKPVLLELFEKHYIPLGKELIPSLHGFILALLPGLEEGSEHFERVSALIDTVKKVTDRTLFYGSLWRALISAPTLRYQGSFYVLMQITKRRKVGQAMLGDNRQTLIKSLCLGLQDTNVLTQRNFLDFILFASPLNSNEFSQRDLLELLKAALSVLLRRDMSLNRRLYNWLEGHGADESNEQKRISMTSQELQSLMDEVALTDGGIGVDIINEEALEAMHSEPLIQQPAVRNRDSIASQVSMVNGSPFETVKHPESYPTTSIEGIKEHHSSLSDSVLQSNSSLSDSMLRSNSTTPVQFDNTPVEMTPPMTLEFSAPTIDEEIGDVVFKDWVSPKSDKKEMFTPLSESTDLSSVLSPAAPDADTSLSQEINQKKIEFFQMYGRPYLMRCLRELLNVQCTDKAKLLQPYRIINSLMDRQDFGSAIIEDILIDINRALHKYCVEEGITVTIQSTTQLKLHHTPEAKELIKAANMLINTFEAHTLWEWLANQITESGPEAPPTPDNNNKIFTPSPPPLFDELLCITDFLLEIVSFEYNAAVQSTYLPCVLKSICSSLKRNISSLEPQHLAHAIETSSNLLSRAQPTTVVSNVTAYTTPEPQEPHCEAQEPHSETQETQKTLADGELQMDDLRSAYTLQDDSIGSTTCEEVLPVPSQDFVQAAIDTYQSFLAELISTRVVGVYNTDVDTESVVSMFQPACRLLLDFACFPIFCNIGTEPGAQPLMLTDNTFGKSEEGVTIPPWLQSLIECAMLIKWEFVVLTATRTLSVLIGLTLSIAEEQGAGRKTLEGSVAVVLMPMLSSQQLYYIQSNTTYFSDIMESLWGYLAAEHACLHQRVVRLLWKLHHLAPASDITENVMGRMLASCAQNDRLEGLRRFTVFWHISAKLSDNCKEWSKLQISGKDFSRTTLVLLECLSGTDYQSRLLSKAWISQCFHYGDLNRIMDPLLIQILHPASARKVSRATEEVSVVVSSPNDTNVNINTNPTDASSLNRKVMLTVLLEDNKSETSGDYSTADSTNNEDSPQETLEKTDLLQTGVDQNGFERKRTDCQNELYYYQEYDTNRSKYVWQIILSMLTADPTPFIRSCYNAKFNATSKYLSQEVYELFHKHRMSIRDELYADPFFMTQSDGKDNVVEPRLSVADRLRKISKSYLELLVTVCLWYARSKYDYKQINKTVFESNCEVRLVAVEFLSMLVKQCISLPPELQQSATETLFERCHLQESVLYILQRSIIAHTEASFVIKEDLEILEWTKSFQSELLVLVQNILNLEASISYGDESKLTSALEKYEFDHKYVNYYMNCQDTHITKVNLLNNEEGTASNPIYLTGQALISQPLFIHCVLVALTTRRVTFIHKKWLDTIFSCFDYKSPILKILSTLIMKQILHNIYQLTKEYNNEKKYVPVVGCVPVNQLVLLLESLTSVVHFTLIHAPSSSPSNTPQGKSGFFEIFFSSDESNNQGDSEINDYINPAKHGILQYIPKCFDTLLDVWYAWKMTNTEKAENLFPWGHPPDVKNLVLNFVTPLFKKYPASMLSSLVEVWHLNRRNLIFGRPGNLVSSPSRKQLALIDLLMDVRVCTFESVLKNTQKLLNTTSTHPKDSREQFGFSFEVEMLHLSYEFFKQLKRAQMQKSWPHLVNLLRETCSITNNPPVTLLSLGYLKLFLTNCPQIDDVKSRRELQEVTAKLVEQCTDIASKSLSAQSWFGRKTEVLPVYTEIVNVKKELDSEGSESASDQEEYEGEQVYTLQAIYVLNECLAQIIDLVYGSEEKDKANAIIAPLISKIVVFVRNHAHHNMPNAKASAALLSSITDYQYCRKAWAKELFDTFLDSDFFVIDSICLGQWKIIIEHLIAHDNLLFTDLLTRVTVATGGLFSSNEVFYQQKARLIRRLTFTMYCCEFNQYCKFISKIQECFVDALKLTSAYNVIQEVFLGFRVVILRMSPGSFTPLWPIMLSELYSMLVELRDLLRKCEDRSKIPQKALQMYLSVCKLLDMALITPAKMIPDFQVHNWTFVSDRSAVQTTHTDVMFKCLASEIAEEFHKTLEDREIVRQENAPFLTNPHISDISELHPFFLGLSVNGLFGAVGSITESDTILAIESSMDLEFLDQAP